MNPLYHAGIAAIEYYHAAKRGDAKEAGRQAFKAVSNVASLGLMFAGGGGGAAAGAAEEASSITFSVPAVAATPEGGLVLIPKEVSIAVPKAATAAVQAVRAGGPRAAGVLMMAGNGGEPPSGKGGSGGKSSSTAKPSRGAKPSERPGQSNAGARPARTLPGAVQEALEARQVAAAGAPAPLKEAFPDAEVEFRGSLARGFKGPHKGNAPFSPRDFDVDAFVVSDKLAGIVKANSEGFGNLASLPQFQGLVRTLDRSIKKIPGVRPDAFKVRVFSRAEFEAKVGADERYFVRSK